MGFCVILKFTSYPGILSYNCTGRFTLSTVQIAIEAIDSGLQWIILASLAVAMSMVVLKWRRGTLTGRIFQIMAGGAVIYAFAEAGLDVARQITGGVTYELDPGVIYNDWGLAVVASSFIGW